MSVAAIPVRDKPSLFSLADMVHEHKGCMRWRN